MSNQENLDNSSQSQHSEEYKEFDYVEKEFSLEELKETISWNTRKVKLKVINNTYSFFLANLSEKKKYGSKTSEKIDINSGLCSNAFLSVRENQIFLSSTEFKGEGKLTKSEREEGRREKIIPKVIHSGIKRGAIYLDEDKDFVFKKEIEVFNEEDKKLKLFNSSLFLKNSPNVIEIHDTIDINEAFDHNIKYRYVLFPEDEDSSDAINLIELLYDLEEQNPPKYLAFKFNYYPNYHPKDAFLQLIEENDEEYILMNVGNKIEPIFYGLDSSVGDAIEIEEDFDFDLSI